MSRYAVVLAVLLILPLPPPFGPPIVVGVGASVGVASPVRVIGGMHTCGSIIADAKGNPIQHPAHWPSRSHAASSCRSGDDDSSRDARHKNTPRTDANASAGGVTQEGV